MANGVDVTWRRCGWDTVGLSVPALVAAVLLFYDSFQSDSLLALLWMAIAFVCGLPIVVALVLPGISFVVRRRSPNAARVLSVTAISIVGAVAPLAFVVFVPGVLA